LLEYIRKPRRKTPRPRRFLFGEEAFFVVATKEFALLRKLRTSSPAEGRGCAEAHIGAAELALSLPNGRSVEILPLPPPKAVAKSVGGPAARQGGKGLI